MSNVNKIKKILFVFCRYSEWKYARLVLLRISILIGTYTILRIIFYFINWRVINEYDLGSLVFFNLLFKGLWYDFYVILLINIIYIFFELLPFNFRFHKVYRFFLKSIFLITNGLAIFISIVDIFYYQHAQVRSSGAIVGMLDGSYSLLFQYSMEYWYSWILFFLIISIIYWLPKDYKENSTPTSFILQILIFIGIIVPVYIISKKTINHRVTQSGVITNTPFVILNSIFNDLKYSP